MADSLLLADVPDVEFLINEFDVLFVAQFIEIGLIQGRPSPMS